MVNINICYSQEITRNEYEIYGTFIGEQGYKSHPVKFEIPEEDKSSLKFNDSIAVAIHASPMKFVNYQELIPVLSKYKTLEQKYKKMKYDTSLRIYLSPIIFKKAKGYFFAISKTDLLPKPNYMFLVAHKEKDKWIISNYYNIF